MCRPNATMSESQTHSTSDEQPPCTSCGRLFGISDRFCGSCGGPRPRVCTTCAAVNLPGANFCSQCATKLFETTAAVSVPEPAVDASGEAVVADVDESVADSVSLSSSDAQSAEGVEVVESGYVNEKPMLEGTKLYTAEQEITRQIAQANLQRVPARPCAQSFRCTPMYRVR